MRPIVSAILLQHVEDAVMLHANRTFLTTAPQGALRYLRRFDDRLVAHLDGIAISGKYGRAFVQSVSGPVSAGGLFVATVIAMNEGPKRLEQSIDVAEGVPAALKGLLSAFGWQEPETLQGFVVGLLSADDPFRRLIGVAACGLHRLDPGIMARRRIDDPDAAVRARMLRTAGDIGCQAQSDCADALNDSDPNCQFWSARSAVLLGGCQTALDVLMGIGFSEGPYRARAFSLALQAMAPREGHIALQQLSGTRDAIRWLIQGSGINGDPTYVPWLIEEMTDAKIARLAGEAFSLVTGADLALLNLERKPPGDFQSGPNDDPDDPNVDMDPDDGLPWPDAQKIKQWWAANRIRFQAGQRYFMGAPVAREHCVHVLKTGYQRQRILAAHYLCLLEPGTPLFNTSAPAWRQQKQLAQLT
jgi:uncharacterized protein (TIGR02270 family)